MGLGHSPSIVTNNLFLSLDARNPKATNSGGDFLYSSVSMLLLGETTADSSLNAVTMTATGSAAASSTQYKYGSKSLYFGGAGNYLSTPNATIFQLGSGDWTIECWVYITSNAGINGIISKRNAGTYDAYCVGTDSSNQFWITITNTAGAWTLGGVTLGTGVTPNAWHHLAAVRNGNTITGYVNGVPGTPQSFTGAVYDSGKSVYIGNSDGGGSTQNFNGYIDDFRITKGYARYTSRFTPPSNQLPNYTMSNWADLSGNRNNASLSGGCHVLSDSMYYNGSGNASVTGLNTTLYALEVVFRNYQALNSSPETDNSPFYSLLGFVSNGANTRTIGLGSWTGSFSGETISWWTNYPGSYGSYITDNISYGFHHLFINYNGSTYDIWVDGTKRTVGNATGAPLMTNLTSITVGYSAWSSYYFKGDIALVRAYNAALTDAQVLQNFSAIRGRFGL
jgi:hypothetical protein